MARLLLVRHGETELQSSLRYWGRTDVPLAESGVRQAEMLRDRLAGVTIEAVYSSPLKRAERTAGILAAPHHLAPESCPELREIDFGEIEGLTYSEIQERYPEVARLWAKRSEELVYPRGESLSELEARVSRFTAKLKRDNSNRTLLVVAHAGVLRSLICGLLGLGPRHRWNLRLDLASLSIVETFPQLNMLNLLNDTSHLKNGETDRSR